jgi:hypothetical protein
MRYDKRVDNGTGKIGKKSAPPRARGRATGPVRYRVSKRISNIERIFWVVRPTFLVLGNRRSVAVPSIYRNLSDSLASPRFEDESDRTQGSVRSYESQAWIDLGEIASHDVPSG